jgi:hypothetical protein
MLTPFVPKTDVPLADKGNKKKYKQENESLIIWNK